MSQGGGYYDKYHGIHLQITTPATDGSGHLADEAARRLAADRPFFFALSSVGKVPQSVRPAVGASFLQAVLLGTSVLLGNGRCLEANGQI